MGGLSDRSTGWEREAEGDRWMDRGRKTGREREVRRRIDSMMDVWTDGCKEGK